LLRVHGNKAGRKVRCRNCGAVSTIPTRALTKPEDEATVDERHAAAEQDEQAHGDTSERVGQPESVPTPRRKRVRRPQSPDRVAYLRNAPGWRKVRLGLILIALSMTLQCLGMVGFWFVPLGGTPFTYLLQALPIAGNLLCVFVPLKGTARRLATANLVVIAFGLALTLVAGQMTRRALDQSFASSQELMKKTTESDEEQALRKRLAELSERTAAGDVDAAKEEHELRQILTELQTKRLAAFREASARALAELQDASSKSVSGVLGFWTWIEGEWILISVTIQIIIMSFFIRTIAFTLDDRDLAGNSPRVAALALLTLSLVLLMGILPLKALFVSRLLGWILYGLGLVSYVWQGTQLVETCALIGNHLNSRST
jgi:hypothetical protein